ncbi:hypothetical protein [Phytoactinopolyspora limicola]|uniref:hypothetical protein n=1 Tax=Phytoactinopolyspora limicola TaxID=2715536 RepID=UPI00140B9436|nr:hypothetical protein [Phytoactinopolyspora limicola]
MPGRRHSARGRRATRRPDTRATPTSVGEIAVYGVLAVVVAAPLLVAAGQPWWIAAGAGAGGLALIGLLALVARRAGRPHRAPAAPSDDLAHSAPDQPTAPPIPADGPGTDPHHQAVRPAEDDAQLPPNARPSSARHAGARRRRHAR